MGSYPRWADDIARNIPRISSEVHKYLDKKNARIAALEAELNDQALKNLEAQHRAAKRNAELNALLDEVEAWNDQWPDCGLSAVLAKRKEGGSDD